ncbi:MAG: hypothetical protein RR131_07150 [Anaerovorax sp.]
MLGKLLKYEVKSTGRIFVPLYGALAAISIIISLLFSPDSGMGGIVNGILLVLYFSLMVAIAVVTFVVIIQRFYKNLLTDEGYLMFTLPVKTWQLVAGKLLIAMLWSVVSSVVAGLSVFLIMTATFGNFGEFIQMIQQGIHMLAQLEFNIWMTIFEVVLVMILSLAANILLIYAAIGLGHIANRRQILWSVVAYIAILTLLQIVTSLVMKILDLSGVDFMQMLSMQGQINLAIFGTMLLVVVTAVVCYVITVLSLNKKLNLA